MSIEKATELFTAVPKKYNCAETVVEAFGHGELLSQMHYCGGGRAPEGICGALHAALQLLPQEEHEKVKQEFQERAGSLLCGELKNTCKTPCLACVRIASALLEKYQKK